MGFCSGSVSSQTPRNKTPSPIGKKMLPKASRMYSVKSFGFFSCCCDDAPWQKLLNGERVCSSSQFQAQPIIVGAKGQELEPWTSSYLLHSFFKVLFIIIVVVAVVFEAVSLCSSGYSWPHISEWWDPLLREWSCSEWMCLPTSVSTYQNDSSQTFLEITLIQTVPYGCAQRPAS